MQKDRQQKAYLKHCMRTEVPTIMAEGKDATVE